MNFFRNSSRDVLRVRFKEAPVRRAAAEDDWDTNQVVGPPPALIQKRFTKMHRAFLSQRRGAFLLATRPASIFSIGLRDRSEGGGTELPTCL